MLSFKNINKIKNSLRNDFGKIIFKSIFCLITSNDLIICTYIYVYKCFEKRRNIRVIVHTYINYTRFIYHPLLKYAISNLNNCV